MLPNVNVFLSGADECLRAKQTLVDCGKGDQLLASKSGSFRGANGVNGGKTLTWIDTGHIMRKITLYEATNLCLLHQLYFC